MQKKKKKKIWSMEYQKSKSEKHVAKFFRFQVLKNDLYRFSFYRNSFEPAHSFEHHLEADGSVCRASLDAIKTTTKKAILKNLESQNFHRVRFTIGFQNLMDKNLFDTYTRISYFKWYIFFVN